MLLPTEYEKLLVTKEVADVLKDKGFKDLTLGYYYKSRGTVIKKLGFATDPTNISLPTWGHVIDWVRKEKNLYFGKEESLSTNGEIKISYVVKDETGYILLSDFITGTDEVKLKEKYTLKLLSLCN